MSCIIKRSVNDSVTLATCLLQVGASSEETIILRLLLHPAFECVASTNLQEEIESKKRSKKTSNTSMEQQTQFPIPCKRLAAGSHM